MINLKEYSTQAKHLSDYLPWACSPVEGVILNKDGSFQKTFRYRGPDLESSTQAELIAVMARANNVFRRFGSGWALFFEASRNPALEYPHSEFGDAASWLVEQERRLRFEETTDQYESQYYLTVLWLPPADATGKAQKALIERSKAHDPKGWRDRLETFIGYVDRAYDLLNQTLQSIEPLNNAETLQYLHECVSTKRHPITPPELPVFLDSILADEHFTGGMEPKLGESHIRTLTILGFPSSTIPGILDDLNAQGFSYRWCTRFIAMDKHQAEKVLNRQRRHWFAKRKNIGAAIREVMFNEQSALVDNDADNKALDADEALQELGNDLVSFGYVTTTVTVSDPNLNVVEEKLRIAERIINGRGFTAIRETLNAVEAWLGSLPGHVYANVRQPILHTLNLSHMTPLSAVWAGEPYNRHLDQPSLIQALTNDTTPFRVNLHVGDVGHSLAVGPTGAGKSVLLSLIAMQWRRYEDAQIFIFDKGKSARASTLAMGGVHIDLGGEQSPSLQPLANIDKMANASFADGWVTGLCEKEGVEMTPEKKAALWSAIQSLATAPVSERTLTGLSMLLQDDELKAALHPYTIEGPLGHLLDADRDDIELADTVCFEMEDLMATEAAIAPVITYLFHRLEERFDGRPTIILLDEAWLFLDDPLFAPRIREWLKTLRKKNVSVVFFTQSLADIAQSSIAPAIIESCTSRFFLPNERAIEPQQKEFYQAFGLNDRQIDLIASATPKRHYYYQSPLGARVFELALGPVALAFCGSSNPADQKLIDGLLETSGADFAEAYLHAKDLSWAVNIYRLWPGFQLAEFETDTPQIIAAE
jgi:type IV secretion system protein VirB4